MGSEESHFNVSIGSDGQSHKTVSTNHNFWRERGAEAVSNRGSFRLPAYCLTARPNRLSCFWVYVWIFKSPPISVLCWVHTLLLFHHHYYYYSYYCDDDMDCPHCRNCDDDDEGCEAQREEPGRIGHGDGRRWRFCGNSSQCHVSGTCTVLRALYVSFTNRDCPRSRTYLYIFIYFYIKFFMWPWSILFTLNYLRAREYGYCRWIRCANCVPCYTLWRQFGGIAPLLVHLYAPLSCCHRSRINRDMKKDRLFFLHLNILLSYFFLLLLRLLSFPRLLIVCACVRVCVRACVRACVCVKLILGLWAAWHCIGIILCWPKKCSTQRQWHYMLWLLPLFGL